MKKKPPLILAFSLLVFFCLSARGLTCADLYPRFEGRYGATLDSPASRQGPSFVMSSPEAFYSLMQARRAESRLGAPSDYDQFDVPELAESLNWMSRKLASRREAVVNCHGAGSDEVRFFEAVREEVRAMEGSGRIPYRAFLDLSVRGVAALGLNHVALDQKHLDYVLLDMNRLLAKYPAAILLPTELPLDKLAFNDVRHVPIYFMGLTTQVITAHLKPMPPLRFLEHDLIHARAMAESDFRILTTENFNSLRAPERLWTPEVLAARSATKAQYDLARRHITDAATATAVEAVGFEIYHEGLRAPGLDAIDVMGKLKVVCTDIGFRGITIRALSATELNLISMGGPPEQVIDEAIQWQIRFWKGQLPEALRAEYEDVTWPPIEYRPGSGRGGR